MKKQFRCQFLFGPSHVIEKFSLEWPALQLDDNILKTHPDLKVSQGSSKYRRIILLGLAFHCYNPDFTEEDIVDQLSCCVSYNDFLNEIDCLCGTFVIVEQKNEGVYLYHDVASSGKIFYLKDTAGSIVGSDPMIIKQITSLKRDIRPEAMDFYESLFFTKKGSARKWIGDRTYYEALFQVLPNHGLDYYKQCSFRYFPREERRELPIDIVISKSTLLLKNLSYSAFNRKKVFIPLTAGWDSRVITSTTKNFAKKINFFTFLTNKNITNNVDIKVAQKICEELSLKHTTIIPNKHISKSHLNNIKKSYELVNHFRYHNYLKFFNNNVAPKDTIILNGVISEITKNYYERLPLNSGKELARAAHYPNMQYVTDYFQEWLDSNKGIIEECGYSLPDFAHWEQDIANFAGQGMFHLSYVVDQLSLFNCRELTKTLLQSNPKYRDGHTNILYKNIIKELWPELLEYPVNPTLRRNLIVLTKELRIYDIYKKIWQQFDFWKSKK